MAKQTQSVIRLSCEDRLPMIRWNAAMCNSTVATPCGAIRQATCLQHLREQLLNLVMLGDAPREGLGLEERREGCKVDRGFALVEAIPSLQPIVPSTGAHALT
eukprot:14198179-Alexandrium_andersonii.AAC.1